MYPDRRLRVRAAPVTAVDARVRVVWAEMLAAMYAMPGVGLAAPQLGEMLRLAVVDASDACDAPVRMANPEIVAQSKALRTGQEGSPNLPGLWADVTRPAEVTVRFLDSAGAVAEQAFQGLWAASVQHQIDHLEGRLFIDRLSPTRRRMLIARHQKRVRRAGGAAG